MPRFASRPGPRRSRETQHYPHRAVAKATPQGFCSNRGRQPERNRTNILCRLNIASSAQPETIGGDLDLRRAARNPHIAAALNRLSGLRGVPCALSSQTGSACHTHNLALTTFTLRPGACPHCRYLRCCFKVTLRVLRVIKWL